MKMEPRWGASARIAERIEYTYTDMEWTLYKESIP
jgi:hypothetical protein